MKYVIRNNSVLVGRMLPFLKQEAVEDAGCPEFDRSRSRLVFDSDTADWVVHALQPTLGPYEVEMDVDIAGVSYLVCL